MIKTIAARYRKGRIEPLEPLELEEGTEVNVTITTCSSGRSRQSATTKSAGAWRDLLDCATFEREVYQSRLIQTRPEVRL